MTQVYIKKCANYEYAGLYRHIETLLDHFDQTHSLFKSGQTILLKPNMLTCRTPDHAATTHPAVVQAVAQYLQKKNCRVRIGDSPPAVFGRTAQFWQETGFAQAAAAAGAELVCFESEAKKAIRFLSNGAEREVHLTAAFFDADLVINLPKLKTHNLTRITGAVKNLFGLVPGLQKAQWHKVFPKSVEFGNFISDLGNKLPTQLTIMDAIEGMQGQGPAGGTRIFPGFLMASTCPVAVDRIFCEIGGVDENKVTTLTRARQLNWGPPSAAEISLLGDPIAEVKIADFKVPALTPQDYLPDRLLNLIKKLFWAGPVLKEGSCIRCGRCEKICPVNAISISAKEAEFDRKLCISCFCCMEVCPVDAIIARKSPLLQLAFRIRQLKRTFKRKK